MLKIRLVQWVIPKRLCSDDAAGEYEVTIPSHSYAKCRQHKAKVADSQMFPKKWKRGSKEQCGVQKHQQALLSRERQRQQETCDSFRSGRDSDQAKQKQTSAAGDWKWARRLRVTARGALTAKLPSGARSGEIMACFLGWPCASPLADGG